MTMFKLFNQHKQSGIFCGAMKSVNFHFSKLIDPTYQHLVGLNTGNLVIGDFARKPFRCITQTESFLPFKIDKNLDFINSQTHGIVIFAANWIAHYMKSDFSEFNKLLKQITVPVTIIGLGSHTPKEEFSAKDFVSELNPTLIEFLQIVSEKNASISVRGKTTEKLLHEIGIYNVDVTGCPTWYVNGKNDLQIKKKIITRNSNILFHADPEKRDVYRILFELFKEYKNKKLLIQSEFDLLPFLTKKNISDYNNNYRLDCNYIKNQDFGVCFTNTDIWKQYIQKKVDISFGLRIHGTIITLKSGKPAILITHDGRTKEMAELFHIPHIDVDDLYQDNFCFEKVYENADFSEMHKAYPELFKNYKNFLQKNNIPFNF